jgi:hypothetical protein
MFITSVPAGDANVAVEVGDVNVAVEVGDGATPSTLVWRRFGEPVSAKTHN